MRPLDATLRREPRAHSFSLPFGLTWSGVVLAATLPLVFLHVDYQPSVSLSLGGLSPTFKLSDALVLATAVAAALAAAHGGVDVLRGSRTLWIAVVLFLAWIVAATFYPLLSDRVYPWKTHLVTAGEFCEYALLAPAVPLLLRRRADALLAAGTLVGWTIVATVVGVVQWAGWSGLAGWGRGHRQPSFLGPHDFAALAALTLTLGMLALLWRVRDPRLRLAAWTAVAVGVIGFVIGGASAGIVGLVPAVAALLVVASRRGLVARRALVVTVAATAVASLGVVLLRAGDFDQFFRFLGFRSSQAKTSAHIQTYSQRTVLAYIGARIWLHHPIVGVGWNGSSDPAAFVPELPAAHARFPDVAEIAFPAPEHAYGVQNLYIQVLADLGVVGFVLLVALFAAAAVLALRTAMRAPPAVAFAATLGLSWLLLAAGLWTALGLVAGIPLAAATWLAFGLTASSEERPA